VLIADSNESVHALNQRARADLILDGTVNALREVELRDARAGPQSVTRSSPAATTGASARPRRLGAQRRPLDGH
jgi:hypothetical protein